MIYSLQPFNIPGGKSSSPVDLFRFIFFKKLPMKTLETYPNSKILFVRSETLRGQFQTKYFNLNLIDFNLQTAEA